MLEANPDQPLATSEGEVAAEQPSTWSPQSRPDAGTITMFTTTWCGYCVRLKGQLGRAAVPYTEVNIEQVPAAAEFVMSVNGGNATVPTVLFPDGSSATNPSIQQVTARLSR